MSSVREHVASVLFFLGRDFPVAVSSGFQLPCGVSLLSKEACLEGLQLFSSVDYGTVSKEVLVLKLPLFSFRLSYTYLGKSPMLVTGV